MSRRLSKNKTNINRISGLRVHEASVLFMCIRCGAANFVNIGGKLLTPAEAFQNQVWECEICHFVHSKDSPLPLEDHLGNKLPFATWDQLITTKGSLALERFWKSFFMTSTETHEVYWKQCNTCGRKLPASAFSKHKGWGPLEKQMECRSCKAVINTTLNPKRTKEQLHESALRRRVADLLLMEETERLNFNELFERFDGKCFKSGKVLDINDRKSWAIDHILPSRWLYPLTSRNAALLSKEANNNKRDKWPSEFYSNDELKKLAIITGANLELISRKTPVVNDQIDVNACVDRMLNVRTATDIGERLQELKGLLEDYELVKNLSVQNKKILGYSN